MQIKFDSNLDQFSRELVKRADALRKDLTKEAVTAATQSLFVKSKALLTQLIYQKNIPQVTRKRGKFKGQTVPLWRRKMRNGGLLGTETFWVSADGTQGTVGTEPGSKPAQPIKNWPGGYSEKRQASTTRPAPWRERANQQGMPTALEKFREVLEDGLE